VVVSQHRDEHLELCAGYALGSLDAGDQRALEAHLAEGCTVCEAELERLGAGVWLLANNAPQLRAPAALRGRVLDAVRAEPRPPIPLPQRRRVPVSTWAWAAAAVLIAAAGVFQWQAANVLQKKLAETRGEIARLEQQLDEERSWAALPEAPDARVIRLEPTPAGSPQLSARVTYDPATRRALVVCSDFTAPTGKDYELWAILKSGPQSLGLVHADRAGYAVVRVADAGDPLSLAAFAVSLENQGGAPTSTAPAGPVVMVGKTGG
jgi:anti-sigma-K factor RskA